MKRFIAIAIVLMMALAGTATTAGAQGPPKDVIDANWLCGGEAGLPDGHCINGKSSSATFTLLVIEEDGFRQETGSFNPKADDRPCPHDPEATDGTYWEPLSGLFVCHHTPSSPPGRA